LQRSAYPQQQQGDIMPDKRTMERARADQRAGKSGSTQAGEFVREEMHHVREGKHGARSSKQAIAIGLSKARRAGVRMKPPAHASEEVQHKAERDSRKGEEGGAKVSRRRSRATLGALKKEGHSAASHGALSKQAHSAARKRSASDRSAAARKAARTKGSAARSAAAKKAARTRARSS
jgi:hypothetical protein